MSTMMKSPALLSILLTLAAIPLAAATPAALSAFLDQHCAECHDADVKKSGLDVTSLSFDALTKEPLDAAAFHAWQKIYERVRDGEMPPKKKPQPAKPEKSGFLTALKSPLVKADAADIAERGRVRSRRLTRVEYEHTMHDLLGIDIPLKNLLPEDPASHGFQTVAEGQQLSQHQLGRYLDVADIALADAFTRALEHEKGFERFCTPKELAAFTRGNYRGPDFRDGKSISWPITLQFFGRMKATEAPEDGWYRVTLRGVHAINPGADGAVWGVLRSGICYSNAPMLHMIGLVEATATPRDLTYEAWIQKDHMLELRPQDATLKRAATGANGGNVSFKGRDLAKDGFEGIAHSGIEITRIHPHADQAEVRRRLFGQAAVKKADAEIVEKLVTRFATRAFRRPVTEEQSAPYRAMARQALQDGDGPVEALRAAYRAVLCSPRFLTFIEAPGALDDHAIASRLSYALWVSMPDAELIRLAEEKKLRDPAELSQQVGRMLTDARARRFIHSFTDQWLKLNQIDFTSPDTRLYRTFDPVVQESMLQETRAYVSELITKDLGITHLVDSDFAFLNGRLARHYAGMDAVSLPKDNGKKRKQPKDKDSPSPVATMSLTPAILPTTAGGGLQRVTLPASSMRGGLVTQGAILKVTADGTSTSPVVRGVFVNERILGEHIPPPPPGIPAIEPDIRGATSIRDQLEKHRNNESCASCHQMIDPPGFALENYDPVGVWRDRYGRDGTGVRVNASGTTGEGDAFTGLKEWQKIYSQRANQLARGFAAQFLTYATGAPPRFSNEPGLEKIVSNTAKTGHGTRAILREAVLSEMFLRK
jgi:hypothetical protein